MNLHLVLTHHWYDEVASGRKRIEYRDRSLFWFDRIWRKRHDIKTVTFARGYTSTTLKFNVTKIDIGPCPYPEWDQNYYRVHFEEDTQALDELAEMKMDKRKVEQL